MNAKKWLTPACLFLTLTAAAVSGAPRAKKSVGEWPQWRGPERNGLSQETGLLKSWPEGGPKLLWKATGMGGGYTAPSVAGGRLYGMGYVGEDEVVWARDTRSGAPVWSTRIASANHMIGYGEGSRCTPTVDGDRVYALGTSGDLVCLQRLDGKVLWHKNLVVDFGGKVPNWGYTESPLVDGDKLIATPGGAAATLVALNKTSGEVIWRGRVPQGDAAAYSSVIAENIDGQRQYIAFLTGGVVGLSAADGKFLWRTNRPANGIVIATPVYRDHLIFASTAYNKGGGLIRLTSSGDGSMKAEEVYFDQTYQNHHGGVLLLGDYLYYSEGHQIARLTCREFKTGKLMWADENKTKCSLVYADGNIYARSEKGTMMLIEANPNKLVVKGSFEQPDRSGKNDWAHPVVAGGKLYLRDQDVLLCYDVHDPALK